LRTAGKSGKSGSAKRLVPINNARDRSPPAISSFPTLMTAGI
jgi:hypothetical protein